jgi:serine/threonine-protein kinase
MQQAAAEQTLSDAGFDSSLGPQVFSSNVPRGSVVSQSVSAGDSARPHSAIVLGISKGPQIVNVPNVAGDSGDKAKSLLTKAGLNPSVQQKFDEKVPQGDVISQSPRGGNIVNSGTKVTIVVSKGPPPVTIPTVTGLSAKDAEASLRGAGLVVDTTEHYSDKVTRGDVISQDPRAGSIVDQGSKIKLDVSLGPKTFPMPDLTGLSESSALAKCKSLGLKATTSQVPGSSGSKVVGQTPAAGKTVSAGTKATIFVGG